MYLYTPHTLLCTWQNAEVWGGLCELWCKVLHMTEVCVFTVWTYGCWIRQPFVSGPVCDIHGQDVDVELWTSETCLCHLEMMWFCLPLCGLQLTLEQYVAECEWATAPSNWGHGSLPEQVFAQSPQIRFFNPGCSRGQNAGRRLRQMRQTGNKIKGLMVLGRNEFLLCSVVHCGGMSSITDRRLFTRSTRGLHTEEMKTIWQRLGAEAGFKYMV